MALRLKQQRFAEEYLIDGNATQAAIRSGYSKQSARAIASQNLTKLNVLAEIHAKQAEIAAKKEVTLERLSDMFIADRELAREVTQMSAAVSATDKLARLHGFMIDKSINMNVTTQMSDEDLMALVRQLQQAPQLSADNNPPPLAIDSVDTLAATPVKRQGRKPLKRKAIRKPQR